MYIRLTVSKHYTVTDTHTDWLDTTKYSNNTTERAKWFNEEIIRVISHLRYNISLGRLLSADGQRFDFDIEYFVWTAVFSTSDNFCSNYMCNIFHRLDAFFFGAPWLSELDINYSLSLCVSFVHDHRVLYFFLFVRNTWVFDWFGYFFTYFVCSPLVRIPFLFCAALGLETHGMLDILGLRRFRPSYVKHLCTCQTVLP